MDTHWDSVDALTAEFGLQEGIDTASIRAQLRLKLASLHPDTTGGTFASAKSETDYHRVAAAIKWLESRVPAPAQMPDVLQILGKIEQRLETLGAADVFQVSASEKSKRAHAIGAEAAAFHRRSRLRSAVFAAIASGIITFSQLLQGNPLFGWIAHSAWATGLLLVVFVVSGGLYTLSWLQETRVSRRVEWLLSDEGLTYLVKNTLDKTERDGAERPTITKRAMVQQVLWFYRPWHQRPFLRRLKRLLLGVIPTSTAEAVVQIQLTELLRRGAVTQAGFRGIDPMFTIDPARVAELDKDHTYFLDEWPI